MIYYALYIDIHKHYIICYACIYYIEYIIYCMYIYKHYICIHTHIYTHTYTNYIKC